MQQPMRYHRVDSYAESLLTFIEISCYPGDKISIVAENEERPTLVLTICPQENVTAR